MIWLISFLGIVVLIFMLVIILKFISSLSQQFNILTQQLNERLKETQQSLQEAHRTVGERLDSATRIFGEVQKSLGRLEETQREIFMLSKDIANLQDLLRAPKFRGEVGEILLENLLREMLPQDKIKFQYRFKTGNIADAAIFIGERIVCIDAKFPLENFKKYAQTANEQEKESFYHSFVRDVKRRIEEISSKYILPDENTFDFALMYIPAEAVYYQISRDEELCDWSKKRKVIFVSPNTFYAYLQAILYGLKGAALQRNIAKVFSGLVALQLEIQRFQSDYELVGRHFNDAISKYRDSNSKLERVKEKLNLLLHAPQLESGEEKEVS